MDENRRATRLSTEIFKNSHKFKQQEYVLFEGEAAGAGAPKAGKRPDSLLERRLMKAREEQARLKDAQAACRLHSLHCLRR